MKKVLMLFLLLVNFSCYADTIPSDVQMNAALQTCGHAPPEGDPNFCSSFKSIAYCHCHDEHGMPPVICNDMNRLLQIMIATYGNLWDACSARAQKDVPQQECYDNWNYYMSHC